MAYFILQNRRLPKQAVPCFKFQEQTANTSPYLSIKIKGVNWFINSVWHDKMVKPKIGEFIVCIHEKGKLMGILQEDQVFVSSRPGCILYRFSETIQWAYLNDLLGIMED